MKKLIIAFVILGTSVSFAATKVDMDSKWICTTNASSSDVAEQKDADDKMAKNQGSAAHSFAYAAEHCRDCTKITCEAQD